MRILIVDDETLARDRLRRMLESDGRHEIIGDVGTGLEALRISEDLRPDLRFARYQNAWHGRH